MSYSVAVTVVSLAIPFLLFTHHRKQQKLPPYHTVLACLVIVHTVFIRHLLVTPPRNIFTQLRIHISAPTDAIRHALIQHTHPVPSTGLMDTTLPEHIESLLNRLRSLEARSLYIRCALDIHLNLPVSCSRSDTDTMTC